MGNKGAKEQVDQFLQSADSEKGRSREELVECLASIADMANTGLGTGLPPVAGSAACGAGSDRTVPPPATNEAFQKANTKLRRRLESLKGSGDEMQMIGNILGEDNPDWANMRNWLVWCMHDNLDESCEDQAPKSSSSSSSRRHGSLNRQSSMDVIKARLQVQQNFELNLRDERNMSAQSSMESNAET